MGFEVSPAESTQRPFMTKAQLKGGLGSEANGVALLLVLHVLVRSHVLCTAIGSCVVNNATCQRLHCLDRVNELPDQVREPMFANHIALHRVVFSRRPSFCSFHLWFPGNLIACTVTLIDVMPSVFALNHKHSISVPNSPIFSIPTYSENIFSSPSSANINC